MRRLNTFFILSSFQCIIMYEKQINLAGRSGPKSSAQTPAKPEEKKKGSKVNPPGSAGTKPDAYEY